MQFPQSDKSEGGLFVKLKDGEKISGVFRGDPSIFHVHWMSNKSYPCTGNGCEYCETGDKAKFRFRVNFITKRDDVFVAMIYEGNYGTYKDLKEMHENNYDLEETLVNVTRLGTNQNTRYSILPVKNNGGLDKAAFEMLSKIPLNSTSKKKDVSDAESFDKF